MSLWDELTGQNDAIGVLQAAAAAARADSAAAGMSQSWLITGPPGSGRSNLAYAFAAALLSAGNPHRTEQVERQVVARSHPDLGVLSTDRVIITVDEVRALVAASQFSPSVASYRVMVIEDADRMTERTSNLLLKALEEPPPRTVWILCAPSEADLLPTVRSRVRSVRLRVPSVQDVAALLTARNAVSRELAEQSAREAQSHVGMAQRLATSEEARARRAETLTLALSNRSVPSAIRSAARFLELAGEDARTLSEQRDAEERESALRSLGVEPGGSVPPALRSQLRALEEDQKRRTTRSLRDGIDRILVDLLSLYRDVLMIQLAASVESINGGVAGEVAVLAGETEPVSTLHTMEAIATARSRIEGNVAPLLALEAMLVVAARRGA